MVQCSYYVHAYFLKICITIIRFWFKVLFLQFNPPLNLPKPPNTTKLPILCLLQIKPDERVLITDRGLLIRWLQRGDAGSYFCTSQEHRFTRNLLHVSLHVLDRGQINAHQPAIKESSENPAVSEPRQRYKDYLRMLSGPARSLDEYCETMWHREKKQKQKGKWKHVQELRKNRNRRHH